jgi:hypothetical protein
MTRKNKKVKEEKEEKDSFKKEENIYLAFPWI